MEISSLGEFTWQYFGEYSTKDNVKTKAYYEKNVSIRRHIKDVTGDKQAISC